MLRDVNSAYSVLRTAATIGVIPKIDSGVSSGTKIPARIDRD